MLRGEGLLYCVEVVDLMETRTWKAEVLMYDVVGVSLYVMGMRKEQGKLMHSHIWSLAVRYTMVF